MKIKTTACDTVAARESGPSSFRSAIRRCFPRIEGDRAIHAARGDIAIDAFIGPSSSEPSVADPPAGAYSRCILGMLGMGAIGEAVARRATAALGARILYSGTRLATSFEQYPAQSVDLAKLLANADVVCLVLPADPLVADWIGRREIELIPPDKLFVARRRSDGIERALAHLSAHYTERVRIGELAAKAGLSDFHFQHRFADVLGITPHRYQLMLRIFHAKSVLRLGMPIRDVATSVGFADQSHLHRYFRRIVGVTPGQYQKRFVA